MVAIHIITKESAPSVDPSERRDGPAAAARRLRAEHADRLEALALRALLGHARQVPANSKGTFSAVLSSSSRSSFSEKLN